MLWEIYKVSVIGNCILYCQVVDLRGLPRKICFEIFKSFVHVKCQSFAEKHHGKLLKLDNWLRCLQGFMPASRVWQSLVLCLRPQAETRRVINDLGDSGMPISPPGTGQSMLCLYSVQFANPLWIPSACWMWYTKEINFHYVSAVLYQLNCSAEYTPAVCKTVSVFLCGNVESSISRRVLTSVPHSTPNSLVIVEK